MGCQWRARAPRHNFLSLFTHARPSPARPSPLTHTPHPLARADLYSNASIFPTFGLPKVCAQLVCHASELPFVFKNVPNFTSFTPAEAALSDAMQAAWGNFAKTGNPNGPGAPAWPAWRPDTRLSLVLNDSFVAESTSGLCGFWDSVGGYFA